MAALCKVPFQRALQARPVFSAFNIQIRHKKKVYRDEDPKNMSWATPLYEYHEQITKEENEEEPPAMLHMVRRVKTMRGRPYWEKDCLKILKLDGKKYATQIHKNTPEVNKLLKAVKHLVEIKPISFPYGLPSDETDYEHCLLQDNGEFVVKQKIQLEDNNNIKVVDRPEERKEWEMNTETLKKDNRKKLLSYNLMSEYFKAKYTYHYNQDKKEYRYNGDQNIGRYRDWY